MTNFRHRTTDQGEQVNRTEHTAESPAAKTGLFATLRALLPADGTGAPASRQAGSARPHVLLALAALTALAATLALGLTLASATSPTVTVEVAEVGFTSARAQGEVDPGGKFTSYHYEYVSKDKFEATGWTEATQVAFNSVEGSGLTPVESPTLNGLDPATEYHLRLLAENEDGTEEDATTFTTQTATAPGAVIGGASAIKVTRAHVTGEVEPNGGDVDPLGPVVPIHWELEYTKASEPAGWQGGGSGTISGEEAESEGQVGVGADLAHLSAATEYLFRLKATRGGQSTTSTSANFTTASSAGPIPTTEPAQDLAPTHASLQGLVNPNGEPTTYWFEYGPTGSYGASVPASKDAVPGADAEVAEGDMNATAIQALYGLTPATTYHYRLVAKNASGEAQGDDQTFATLPEGSAQSCANEQARSEQHSAFLPDCRAYELVSPPEKSGGSVGVDTLRTHVAADGSAVSFLSLTPFGDARGTGVETEYIAQRDAQAATGWSTHAITPPQEPLNLGAATSGGSSYFAGEMSPDLETGVFHAWSPLTDEPDVAQVQNLYLRRGLRDPGEGTWQLLTACPACGATPLSKPFNSYQPPYLAGSSADFSKVIFESELDLTGAGSGNKLYLSEEGHVSLVGVVPPPGATACGGSGPACELPPGNGTSAAGLGAANGAQLENVISTDGTRINFAAPVTANGGTEPSTTKLYQRDTYGTPSTADDTTTLIDSSERTTGGGGSSGALYQGASKDGSRVFFTSGEALTDDTPLTASPHLYMWSEKPLPGGGHLTLIDRDEEPADPPGPVEGVIGTSDDGSYVYFVADSQLVAGRPQLGRGRRGIYLWHDGHLAYVGAFTATPGLANGSDWQYNVSQGSANGADLNVLPSRVSSDGKLLLFVAVNGTGLTGYDTSACKTLKATVSAGCEEFYLYRAQDANLTCASCSPTGDPPGASASTHSLLVGGVANLLRKIPSLSSDGRYVFFTTPDALVPTDTNGAADAYEFDVRSGQASLLSSGTDPAGSFFVGASADGHDAFFATRARLVGSDTDVAYDLYDARVGGGLPEPPPVPAPCEGESCRAAAGAPPAAPPVASQGPGPGNRKTARCSKGKVRKHGKCVKKRSKKHSGKKHHRAGANRRAGR